MQKNFSLVLFCIAFIEGAAVMSVELSGVKMIDPYYGTSLYVWASVLSVTLGGLALGYYLGGRLAHRTECVKTLPIVLLTAAVLIAFMSKISLLVMPATNHLGIRMGSLISSVLFIMPPLVFLGMVSPLIIQMGIKEIAGVGKRAGTVYAVSTAGSIFMTLVSGFYLLPELGIYKTILITAFLLAFSSFVFYLIIMNLKASSVSGALALVLIIVLISDFSKDKFSPGVKHQSEGILGQVEVYDFYNRESGQEMRTLHLNGVSMSLVMKKHIPFSTWAYPHRIATLSSLKPKGSKALLIGLAGGNLAMELKGLGFNLDVVEIDERMPKIGEEYFGFDPRGVHIFIDDGRHFINTTDSKYDIIVIDVLNGEVQPHHLFTREAMESLKNIVKSDGIMMVNFQGYITGDKGVAARSIYKTMQVSGFNMEYYTSQIKEVDGDVLFIASLTKQDFKNKIIDEDRLNLCCQIVGLQLDYHDLISETKLDLNDAIELTDDRPDLEKLNIKWTEIFRSRRIEDFDKSNPHYTASL